MIWSAAALHKATGGQLQGSPDWSASGLEIDSRRVRPGDVFIALSGERHDGHDYAEAAANAGAVAIICERPVATALPAIMVNDSLAAIRDIAAAARDRCPAHRVAITGSVGKTATKELVAAALSAYGPCHASAGNYNNHIGAPLSLARMPEAARYGVFELGMNHAGEIAALSPLIKPHAAVITKIAASHIGHFDSLDAIAAAKAEIFTGLTPGGTAVINADDAYATQLATHARDAGADDIFTIGTAAGASHRIIEIERHEGGLTVTADCRGEQIVCHLALMAPHWAYAALISLALVQQQGLDLAPACEALGGVTDIAGRGRQHDGITADGRRFTLIDDSYNASPASMAAAIDALGSDPRIGRQAGRRVAILADMLELGDQAETLHRDLAADITKAGIDLVICFGPHMAALAAELEGRLPGLCHIKDAETAAATALDLLADGDLILVKGSNGMRTGQVVTSLLAATPAPNGESHAA